MGAHPRQLGDRRDTDTPLARQLSTDPAIGLLRELITEFRGSALTGTLRYTLRLLLLTLGHAGVRELIEAYARARPPHLFASQEAFEFADYLRLTRPAVPWLSDVLELDCGLTRARLDGMPCTVSLDSDPTALLTDLGAGRLPVAPRRGPFRVQLVDDGADRCRRTDGSLLMRLSTLSPASCPDRVSEAA